MFDMNNNHRSQVEITSSTSKASAIKYVDKLMDAFELLGDVESLLNGLKITKHSATDCVITTAQIKDKDFSVRLLFSHDSDKPIGAEIIKECE